MLANKPEKQETFREYHARRITTMVRIRNQLWEAETPDVIAAVKEEKARKDKEADQMEKAQKKAGDEEEEEEQTIEELAEYVGLLYLEQETDQCSIATSITLSLCCVLWARRYTTVLAGVLVSSLEVCPLRVRFECQRGCPEQARIHNADNNISACTQELQLQDIPGQNQRLTSHRRLDRRGQSLSGTP